MTLHGILESCLYAQDLRTVEIFYSDVLNLELISKENNRHLFYKCENSMLLIFNPDHTSVNQTFVGDSLIPLHGMIGAGHLAFSIRENELSRWKKRLTHHHVDIESVVEWPNGYHSLYFRDPAGNSIELVSPALWHE